MNDAFAAKVYPTILYVLDLADRIRTRRGGEPTPQEEFPRLKQYIGQLDSRGADQRDFELAKAALVYWIDEMLVNSDWSYASYWKDNTLERELYDSRDRAWEFFEKAKTARTLSRPDALETYYLCVALGFLGIYRSGEVYTAPAPRAASAGRAPEPPPPAAAGGRDISWFQGGGAAGQPVGESENTWGFDSTPGGPPPAAPPPPPPPARSKTPPPPAKSSAGPRDLPPTLAEWAGPVYAQIAPGGIRGFAPSAACESQRDARPLRGHAQMLRALAFLLLTGLTAVVLGGVKFWLAQT